ncbi:MAG: cytochrome c biogenesis protein ResB, partial [Coriobacteriia bacterium]|nr:cytochrome c biogenesis protein ResB [Coriobacteriia bacterium]
MNTLYKRLFRFLSSPRVAVILLVYICLFAIVGTLVPQTGLEIDSPISAFLEVNVVASAVSTLGLHDAFSSPAFLLPVAFLLMSTCACAWKRFMVARKRSQMIAEISQSQRTVGGRSLGISFPSDRINAHDQKLIADTLEELSFGTPYHSEQLVCASRSVWALYASPLFHILLAITLAVILAGRLTRSEALMVAPIDQTRTITQENLDITQRGAFHTFASPPPNILLISKEENYITDGQPRGSAGELAIITEAGRVEKKQLTYVNRPLSFRSLMIHVADDGFALKFSVLDETNERESSHYEFTRISDFEGEVTANNAHELF